MYNQMSLNYETLTGLSILDNIDYLNVKSLTAQEITDTGLNRNQPIATNTTGKLVSQPLTDGQLIIGNTTTSSYNAATLTAGSSNQVITNGAGSITVDISRNLSLDSVNTTYWVNPTMTQAQIQAVLDDLNCQQVIFDKGTYTIGCLNIRRGNIVLEGNMSKLFMPNGTNNPNILVGDKTTNPPTTRHQNIVIRNFRMDGNQTNQTSETMSGYAWIYNNCITINYCSNVIVENCFLYNSISGGMTITYQSNNIKFLNCTASYNFYDGYTAYGSTNIILKGCYADHHATHAGASFDTNARYITMDGCVFTNNKLGIFSRDCYDVVVSGCLLSDNQGGMFLSGYGDTVSNRGTTRWTITGNSISNNTSWGLWLQSCNDFSITGNVISGNYGKGIDMGNDTPGNSAGTCSYCNISGNVITANGGGGFYNNPNNDYTTGARGNYLSLNVIKNNTGLNIDGDLTAWSQEDDTQLNSQQLVLHNSSGNYANINPSATGNCTFTFPNSTGASNNLLQTDGTGKSSWTQSPTVADITVAEAVFLRDEGFLAGSGGIYSRRASDLAGGCKIDSYDGSIYFKGGTTASTHVVYDYLSRPCFKVYNNGSNGPVGINNGKVEFAMSGGTTNFSSSQTGGSCSFYLPANDGANQNVLQTDGAGNTSWASCFLLGGNTVSSAAVLGTLNNYPLNIIGNNSVVAQFSLPSSHTAQLIIGHINGASSNAGLLALVADNGETVALVPPLTSFSSYSLMLPTSAGTAHQVLQTDGTGITSWVSQSSNPVISNIGSNIAMGSGVSYYVSLNPITIVGSGSYRVVLNFSLNFDSASAGYIHLYTYDTTTSQNVCDINYYAPSGISTCSCSGITDLATYTAGTTYTFVMAIVPTINTTLLSNSGKIQLYQVPA